MEITRGDLVLAVVPGDYGKPRPALVVQSDLFNPTHPSIVACPLTSHLIETPLFRIPIEPTAGNGLKVSSQAMIDKILALRRDRIRKRIGALAAPDLHAVDEALRLWLGLRADR